MVHVNNITIIGTRIIVTTKERIFHKAFIKIEGIGFWDFFSQSFSWNRINKILWFILKFQDKKGNCCVEELRRK